MIQTEKSDCEDMRVCCCSRHRCVCKVTAGAEVYIGVLKRCMLPPRCTFLGNVAVCKSKPRRRVFLFDWPACSPDLSAINK